MTFQSLFYFLFEMLLLRRQPLTWCWCWICYCFDIDNDVTHILLIIYIVYKINYNRFCLFEIRCLGVVEQELHFSIVEFKYLMQCNVIYEKSDCIFLNLFSDLRLRIIYFLIVLVLWFSHIICAKIWYSPALVYIFTRYRIRIYIRTLVYVCFLVV